jgi:hypothetical protein
MIILIQNRFSIKVAKSICFLLLIVGLMTQITVSTQEDFPCNSKYGCPEIIEVSEVQSTQIIITPKERFSRLLLLFIPIVLILLIASLYFSSKSIHLKNLISKKSQDQLISEKK